MEWQEEDFTELQFEAIMVNEVFKSDTLFY